MKNCGDHVHAVIIERNVLQDMIKIVKKKASSLFCVPLIYVFMDDKAPTISFALSSLLLIFCI